MKPEVRPNHKSCVFEEAAKKSVDVLVRVDGYTGIWIGRYLHGAECWQVNGMGGGPPEVVEWWPMPEVGTGVKP